MLKSKESISPRGSYFEDLRLHFDSAYPISIYNTAKLNVFYLSIAQEFICHGGASSGRQSQDDNSLFQSIIKLLVKLHKDAMAPTGIIEKSLKVAFLLLTNLATLSDCRSLIWKVTYPLSDGISKFFADF